MKRPVKPGDLFLCATNSDYMLRYVESKWGNFESFTAYENIPDKQRHCFKVIPIKGGFTQEVWLDHEKCLMGIKLVGRPIYCGPFKVGDYYLLENGHVYRCMSIMEELVGTFIMFVSDMENTPKRILDRFGRDVEGNPVVVMPYVEEAKP